MYPRNAQHVVMHKSHTGLIITVIALTITMMLCCSCGAVACVRGDARINDTISDVSEE